MLDFVIREVELEYIEAAFGMVKRVFLECDAPDYSAEGISEVMRDMLESKTFMDKFRTREQAMLGAFVDERIIGVLGIGVDNHISLMFVDKEYHNAGVARALVNELLYRLKTQSPVRITLNSTPCAVGFYKKIGFKVTGECVEKHGVEYTPMEYFL